MNATQGEPRAGKRVVWRNHPRSRGEPVAFERRHRGEPDSAGGEVVSTRPGPGR